MMGSFGVQLVTSSFQTIVMAIESGLLDEDELFELRRILHKALDILEKYADHKGIDGGIRPCPVEGVDITDPKEIAQAVNNCPCRPIRDTMCRHVYEEESHGVEMLKMPSGGECAVGGTGNADRFKFDPWCGGIIPKEGR